MAKKRTRAQKIKAAQVRAGVADGSYSLVLPPSQPLATEKNQPSSQPTPSLRADFARTLLSTIVVLGVLLLIFVYTRGL